MAKRKEKFFYREVYDTLKEEILQNHYKYNDLLPSEREIGDRFKVNRTTVRIALSMLVDDHLVIKKAGVGTKVIYGVGVEEDYNSLSSKKSDIIGFFMPKSNKMAERIVQSFYSELLFHLEIFLKAHDYSIIYATLEDEQEMLDFINNHSIRGAIFLTEVDQRMLDCAKRINLPSILVNRFDNEFTCVLGNNIEGGYMAINHLLENNHRRIGIISAPSGYITAKERMIGCQKALAEYGLSMDDAVICQGDWEYSSGVQAVRDITAIEEDKRPTAIFSFNDAMALGAIRALRDLNLRVPQDISVIGFDNLDSLKFTEPTLTTIDTQVERMAQVVVYSLMGLINEQILTGMRIDVPTKLVERGTVIKLPSPDK